MKFKKEQIKELKKIEDQLQHLEMLSLASGLNLDEMAFRLNFPNVSDERKAAVLSRNKSRQQVFEAARQKNQKKSLEKVTVKAGAQR